MTVQKNKTVQKCVFFNLQFARASAQLACARAPAQLAYFLIVIEKKPASQHRFLSLLLNKRIRRIFLHFPHFPRFFSFFSTVILFLTAIFLVNYTEKPQKLNKAICSFYFLFGSAQNLPLHEKNSNGSLGSKNGHSGV